MLDAPKCRRSELQRIEVLAVHWRHVVPADVDWRAPLSTDYWTDMLPHFNPGHLVDVCTSDFAICYQLLIQEVIDLAGYLSFAARPLFPVDLVLPAVSQTTERPRYGVRPSNSDGRFEVVDLRDNLVVKNGMDRGAANDLAYARNEADVAAIVAVAGAGEPGVEAVRRARR